MQVYKYHPLRQLLSEKRMILATTSNLYTYINSRRQNTSTLSALTNIITTSKCFYTSSSATSPTLTKQTNVGVSSVTKGKNTKTHNVINDDFLKSNNTSLTNNTTSKSASTTNAPHKGNLSKATSVTVNTNSNNNKAKIPSTNNTSNNSNNNNAVDLLSRRVVKLVERTTQMERRVNGHDEKIALVEGQQTILEQRIGNNEEVINNLANDVAHSVQLTSNMMMTQHNMDGLIAQVEQRVLGVNDTVRNLENTVVILKEKENNDNITSVTTSTNNVIENNNNYINTNESSKMEKEQTESSVDTDVKNIVMESVKPNSETNTHFNQDNSFTLESEVSTNANEMEKCEKEELTDNQRKSITTLVQVMLAEELRKLNLSKQFDINNEEQKIRTTDSVDKDNDDVSSTENDNTEEDKLMENSNRFNNKSEHQSPSLSVSQFDTEYLTNLPTLSMFTKLEDKLASLTTRLQLLEARLNQMVMEKLIVDRVSQYTLPDTDTTLTQQQQQQHYSSRMEAKSADNDLNKIVRTNTTSSDRTEKDNGNVQNNVTSSSRLTSHNDKVESAIHSRLHIDDQWFEELLEEEEEEELEKHPDEKSKKTNSNEISSPYSTHDRYNDYKYKLRLLLRNAGAFPFKDADGSTRIVSEKIVLRHVPVNWGAAEVRNLCVRCCQTHNKNNCNSVNETGIVSCIVRRAPLPRLGTSRVINKTTISSSSNVNNNTEKSSVKLSEDDASNDNFDTRLRHGEYKYRSECLDANETKLHKENTSNNSETTSSSESSTESINYYTNNFANTDIEEGDDEKYERAFEITFISAQHALDALLALNRCTLNDKYTQHQQKKVSSRSNTSDMPELQRTSSGLRILAEPVISADILEVLRHLQEEE